MAPDDQHETTPASEAPAAPGKKSYDIGAARSAKKRLRRILTGAGTAKTTSAFKGELDAGYLGGICDDFEETERQILQQRKNGRAEGEELRAATSDAQGLLDTILGYVGDLYAHGAPGRSTYFLPGPGAYTLAENLGAGLDGVEADAKLEHPVLPGVALDPALDVTAGRAVVRRLEAAEANSGSAVEQLLKKRNALGDVIREKVKAAERLVRRLHREAPAKLAQYGLNPLPHQRVPKPAKPRASAASRRSGVMVVAKAGA